jgi:hypothetical protein
MRLIDMAGTGNNKKRRPGSGGWNKGLPAWNRGKPWPDEVKARISEGMIRNHRMRVDCHCFACNAETRQKIILQLAACRQEKKR